MVYLESKEELYRYLDWVARGIRLETAFSTVFFLVEYENEQEPVCFRWYEGKWHESSCMLFKEPCTEEDLIRYTKKNYNEYVFDAALEYVKSTWRDGIYYQVENNLSAPFLPDKIIILDIFTENQCIDWLLAHEDKEGME